MSGNDADDGRSRLARMQLRMFEDLGTSGRLTEAERGALLNLSEPDWAAWRRFMQGGPLPDEPALPEILLRIGAALFRMTVAAESPGVPFGGPDAVAAPYR